ncbi:DUF2782 domain-containing protein [Plasticicumulans acidivorans]|uniref:Uncharacterized protein DUF2782 n=1 Tax=Plasticicumulans acidivorans TaxID=886464 RepID=A0A317MZ89_9GAMM|nr:DUF2782 domain-containing protein [Plasticicumulans acidivorans]PWV64874.1 uncharacterized protein DUF2782 [Plasticicumulans acidivorans]
MKRLLPLCALLVAASVAVAQDAPKPPDLQPLPEGADDAQQELQPEVTVIRRDEGTIEEYRVNGKLYMVKVTPSKGYPYYLIDTDGDGNLETRRNDMDPGIAVPSWVLLRW